MSAPRSLDRQRPRVLFIQATEPASYPPLIHAAELMAEAGWDAIFLAAPIVGHKLAMATHPHIAMRAIAPRPSYRMGKGAYARYAAAAVWLGMRLRPDIVYASDALGAAPGLAAARAAGARLIYHEHDNPAPNSLPWPVARARTAAARRAELVIFPNAARASIAQAELGFSSDRLRIIWNLPRSTELTRPANSREAPLVVYYHGSITPERLPLTVAEGIRRLGGRVRLEIAGYEAPGEAGHVDRLVEIGRDCGAGVVHYAGQIPARVDLAALAAQSHVGLALIPRGGSDLNLRHMTGASNKAFEYMAAGLALLVSDLPDWHEMFVVPGYAIPCNATDPGSIAAAICWFLDHPEARRRMGQRGRDRIGTDWNYDRAFAPVLRSMCQDPIGP